MDPTCSHLTCHLVLMCCLVFAVDAQISQVRLAGGSSGNEGRVEILHNGQWGTLCGTTIYGYWNQSDARVVCRTLGYNGVFSRMWYGTFGSGQGSLFDLRCNGTESSIADCSAAIVTDQYCTHSRDAGVICSHDVSRSATSGIRLVNGAQSNEGRVEVYHGGQWKTVYDGYFYWQKDAQVVCRMLGYDGAFAATYNNEFGPGQGSVLNKLRCDGTEQTLGECSMEARSSSSHSDDAGVVCYQERNPGNYSLRLTGTSSTTSRGRVEVYYDGQWGTICGWSIAGLGGGYFYFESQEASVVCRQLGYPGYSGHAYSGNKYGDSPDPVMLLLVCSGNEPSIDQCDTNWGPTSACYSGYENPWVECSGERDECYSSPCQNGGSCIDGDDSYTCTCRAGYEGINCRVPVNECSSSPCLNGGTCTDGDNSYTCTCRAGYGGINCEPVNECRSSPCQNGGTCIDGHNLYTCICRAGYEGINCSEAVNECSSHPCQNGGTCIDGDNAYTCNCASGYEGINCEREIPCSPSPCLNGGTCVERDGSFSCTCVEGYGGHDCGIGINGNIPTREALRGIVRALDTLMTAIQQLMVSSSLAVQDQ